MIHDFTSKNIETIEEVLGVAPKKSGEVYRFQLTDEESGRKLALEIHMGLLIHGEKTNIVSVYTHNTFLQLQNCTGFVASRILNQVTFFGKSGENTTGLIIEKEAGCSLYANVNEALLKGDFTKLPPEVMMGSVALSLIENPDIEGFDFDL
ncbi:MAG: hypothetical protein WD267_02085 [Balneolales bacterium]